ncbi:MAG TPA: succinylglutamate desuccinylase/aspartoacylase family protein [Gammaproteobacteria bacterium]|nr:succinylglutamate desuccinylase/aspartoacylase family protein [Gammaproteobacteria bacterium]
MEVPVPRLYTHTEMAMPVHVIRGKRPGPRMFVSAAIHGDELNGVEVVRRLLRLSALDRIRGTLLAVPIVNVHACIQRSRYLPDGRDLNRSFPGSDRGSLASRMAHVFMSEVVAGSQYGIDLHTGARHRANLPQVRADLDHPDTLQLAKAFAAPVAMHANVRDGSLRQAVEDTGVNMLLYEAGEALRFDETAIRAGVRGIVGVMRAVGMLPRVRPSKYAMEPLLVYQSSWVRAPASGVLRPTIALGTRVRGGDTLGYVSDPFGEQEEPVEAHVDGVIIGRTNLPLVHEGEALFNIGRLQKGSEVEEVLDAFEAEHSGDDASAPAEYGPPIV